MSRPFNFLSVDKEKRKEGVWVDHPSGRFKIGSPTQLQVTRKLEYYTDLIKQKHSTKKDPKGDKYKLKMSELHEVNMKVIAELKVLDWDITDPNTGEKIKFSAGAAYDALIEDSEYSDSHLEDSYKLARDEYVKENGNDDGFEFDYDSFDYISFPNWVTIQSKKLENFEAEKRKEKVKK